MLFYCRDLCLCGEFRGQFVPQHRNLTVDHRRGDFRIDLSGGNLFMSQHLRKRLQTHAFLHSYRRGVRVPCQMERELFVDAAITGDVF